MSYFKDFHYEREKQDQIAKELESELKPYLDGIKCLESDSREFKIFKENYQYFFQKYLKKREILQLLLSPRENLFTDLQGKIYWIFTYLGYIETIGNFIVNILVMLLIANGIGFRVEYRYKNPKIIHATSIKELELIPLETKLNFLKENKIMKLISIIDSNLKNKIANLEFDIKENDFYVEGQVAVTTIMGGLIETNTVFGVIMRLITSLAKERGFN